MGALRQVGAHFTAVNIFEDLELRDALKSYSNWPTYPQLYVKGELVGGCDIAHADAAQWRAEAAGGRSEAWGAMAARRVSLRL